MIKTRYLILSRFLRHPGLRFKRYSLADTGVDVDVLAAAVVKTALFCNASSTFVHALLAAMSVRRVLAGEHILRQGRRSDSFILLAQGQAEITRTIEGGRSDRQLAVLTKPEGLGEEALLGAEIRRVSATMLTDGYILRIRRATFARLISAHGVDGLAGGSGRETSACG